MRHDEGRAGDAVLAMTDILGASARVTRGGSLMVAWRLKGRSVLVVGGGPVAAGRVRAALEADAQVTVVSPVLGDELRCRAACGTIAWRARRFVRSDLRHVDMVMTAIEDETRSRRIAALARARRIPVNVADIPALCDFWFTSVHRAGALQVAVGTNGRAPGLASRIRTHLAENLPPEISRAVERFGVLRDGVRRVDPAPCSGGRRMAWLGAIGRQWSFRALAELSGPAIRRLVDAYRTHPGVPVAPETIRPTGAGAGHVTLVGAGPGDPGLLTFAAFRALEAADLVVADRLVSDEILAVVHPRADVVRRRSGCAARAQREVEGWVVQAAQHGRRVVRLKQGDPFVFGRAGEELERYVSAGLEVSAIPGVSSALAAPLMAGIPLTLRGIADRFVVATAQGANGGGGEVPAFEPRQTTVLLMAIGRAAELQQKLQSAGYPPDWPVALIERASQPEERCVRAEVSRLASAVADHAVRAPAVIVVGRVVELPIRLEAAKAAVLPPGVSGRGATSGVERGVARAP